MKKLEDICIIDDDAISVFSLKRSLESIGHSIDILIFDNGQEAIEHFEQHMKIESNLPSTIFIDLHMPVMDGWGFLEAFTEIYPEGKEMPAIFIMTSAIDAKNVEKAKIYGLENRYLEKPVTSDVLKRILGY